MRRAKQIAAYYASESGAVAPIFGICLFAILALGFGAVALSIDTRSANDLQTSADNAALGGAIAFLKSESPRVQDRTKAAKRQARSLARGNVDIRLSDMDITSETEDEYGQHFRMEVELEFKSVNAAAGLSGRNANVKMRRRAVAGATWGFPLCVLTTTNRYGGIMMEGDPILHAPGCIAWNNSNKRRGVQLDGGETTFNHMCVGKDGRYKQDDTFFGEFNKNCDPLPDPMADLVIPEAGSCVRPSSGKVEVRFNAPRRYTRNKRDHPACVADRGSEACKAVNDAFLHKQQKIELSRTGHRNMSDLKELARIDNLDPWFYEDDPTFDHPTKTLKPGTYCGIDIAYGHVKMEPGTYYIKEAPMTLRRRARLSAEGVTLIFTGPYAHLRISDEAAMRLTAPKDGAFAGIAIAETKDTKPAHEKAAMNTRLTGMGELFIVGLVYLPTQDLFFSGKGTGEQTSPLLQIVARRLAMADNAKLKIDFDPSATDVPVAIAPTREARLIE
ncbi:MAG: Tad domain-containing protein [Pseudomonadota bacterium]